MSYDSNNVFAQILDNTLPSEQVFEDDHTLVIMDIMPATKGHVLVIPKAQAENIYDMDTRYGALPTVESQNEIILSTISQEDYAMGESTQSAIENGLLDHVIFGRNEPALHHFHNTFRAALDMPRLQEYVG